MKPAPKASQTWRSVHRDLTAAAPTARVVITRNAGVAHPRDAGARPTSAWPVGQRTDYRLAVAAGQPALVIQEFDDRWEAALETAHNLTQLAAAVQASPRAGLYVGAAMVGGALGASASPRREAALLGVGLGLLIAVLLDERSRLRDSDTD